MKQSFIISAICLLVLQLHAQIEQAMPSRLADTLTYVQPLKDTVALPFPVRMACKGVMKQYIFLPPAIDREQRLHDGMKNIAKKMVVQKRKPAYIQLHGNVLYDVNYRSYIDTPYNEHNIYQHMLQTYMDATIKNDYPFRVYFTTHWSNSALIRNYSDISIHYKSRDFNNRIRQQVLTLLAQETDSLTRLKQQISIKERQYSLLKLNTNAANETVREVARREDRWFRQRAGSLRRIQDSLNRQNGTDSIPKIDWSSASLYKFGANRIPAGKSTSGNDSLLQKSDSAKTAYDRNKAKLDSLSQQLDSLEQRYRVLQAAQTTSSGNARRQLDQISSGAELKKQLDAWNLPDSSLPKGYKTLYSVRSFGIGRTMLDYSQLSAKNISIMGVQVEYTPHNYMAMAAGTLDYRFQDYTNFHTAGGQYIGLVRYGWGKKDGSNIILTYFGGRKQLYNYYTSDSTGSPSSSLMGFSIEGQYKIGRYSVFTGEVAKSSSPYYSLDSGGKHNTLGSATALNDHTNEAWSVKFNTMLPSTQTKFEASYLHLGANFQSFSLYTTGSEQSAWAAKAEQPFFKRALMVTGAVKTNDYSNPFLNTTYKTSTLFESIQATLRLKKWPVLTAGYFPSSQLIKLSNTQWQENLFYTMMASATHTYKVSGISMMSMLLYTRFYNRQNDSNFVYYNTQTLLLSQTAMLGRLTIQGQISASANTSYTLYVIDGKADYQLTNWLSAGAGLKYNRQTVYDIIQWGYSSNAAIKIPKFGQIRLMEDCGYVPGSQKRLVSNKIGRITYTKIF